ncbi:MAG: hypothetical protein ACNFW9_05700 [Candidatus Kerfeldbacteria bacterium]
MNEKGEQFDQKDIENSPKIEIIRSTDGREVGFSPERGGIITSLKLNDKELFYLDEDTFNNRDKNIKGGIPILFPNAGPIKHADYPNMKQHGFARNNTWTIDEMGEQGFIESLRSNPDTLDKYPYDFVLRMIAKFEKNGSFSLTQEVKNEETDKNLPVSMGLHPYFRIPAELKSKIKFDWDGGQAIEDQVEKWGNGKGAISLENPSTENELVPLNIVIPELGTIVMTASSEYKRIWVWSASADANFFCVEPVMRDKGGLVDDPEIIKPGETLSPKMNIQLI